MTAVEHDDGPIMSNSRDGTESPVTPDSPDSPGSPDLVWHAVCPLDDLLPERGVAALLDGIQVAVFLLAERHEGRSVYVTANLDPFSGAYVMSRGIVGTRGGRPTVASPIYKQVFSLVTGECLVEADKAPAEGHGPDLTIYPASVRDGVVHVGMPGR